MDTKYAYYSTSKGYRVLGGTAAHFLKADGSLDSNTYLTLGTPQNITGRKLFLTAGGNAYNNNSLHVFSDDGSNPGMTFWKSGIDIATLSFDGVGNFIFNNSNGSDSKYLIAKGYKKSGSDNNKFLTGSGGDYDARKKEDAWFHSARNFPQGTLIETDVDYSVTSGDQFLLEMKGNMYGGGNPLIANIQGYIYANTLYSVSGYSTLSYWNYIIALNLNGKLCFWFPSLSYWQGFDVKVTVGYGGLDQGRNRVTGVSDSVDPGGTKRFQINLEHLLTKERLNEGFVTLDTTQTITALKQHNANLAIGDGYEFRLKGSADSAHYLKHFSDDTDGFGVSTGFAVKPYNDLNINLFKVDSNGNSFTLETHKTKKLISNYTGTTSGQNLGSGGIGNTLELRNYDLYGTNFWTNDWGHGHIQQQRFDGNPVAYDLRLQPLGGVLYYGNSEVATKSWALGSASNTLKAITDTNFNDIEYGEGQIWLGDIYNIPQSVTGLDSNYGTILNINGKAAHDKTQLIFDGDNGSIKYRKSWYNNTDWTALRTIWDSSNLQKTEFVKNDNGSVVDSNVFNDTSISHATANTPSWFPVDQSGTILHKQYNSNYATQLALSYYGGLGYRHKSYGNWSEWYKVWTSMDFNPNSYLQNNYLANRLSYTNNANNEGVMANYMPSDDPNKPNGVVDGSLFTLNYSSKWSTQLLGDWRKKDLYFRTQTEGVWNKFAKIWHSENFNSSQYVLQSSLNSQLGNYATLNGVQTFTNTNTFLQSPVIPNGTLGTHAVNVNQLSTKANGQENATAVGFSSGNIPTTDGNSFPYMYHNSGLYVALATQSYVQSNFLNTPNGTSVIISGSNLNNYLKTGFYRGSGLTNAPLNNGGWWYVVIETHDSTWVTQKATSFGSGNTSNVTYQRTMAGGSWSDWAQIWTAQDFTISSIQQWNYMAQYGLQLNSDFTVNTGSGLIIADDYFGGDSGIIDKQLTRFVATKKDEYYFYGSEYGKFDGLNFNCKRRFFGMGMEANDIDKLAVEGSVKALENFKSKEERPDTIFIPNGRTANIRDEIINDKDYSIRLDPHEYEIDGSGFLGVDDRNRLIHVIGEQIKMTVDFKKIYPKQQIVIYNFDQSGGTMAVKIQGKTIANINARSFLRLYVTKSLRVIAERQQLCDFIW